MKNYPGERQNFLIRKAAADFIKETPSRAVNLPADNVHIISRLKVDSSIRMSRRPIN